MTRSHEGLGAVGRNPDADLTHPGRAILEHMDSLPTLPTNPEPTPPPSPRKRGLLPLLGAVLIPAVVAGVVAFGVTRLADDDGGTRTVTVTEAIDASGETVTHGAPEANEESEKPSAVGAVSIPAVVRQAGPGVVEVRTPQGIGTGFLVDGKGHILTNAHVVEDRREVTVIYQDATETTAKVLAADPSIDLAVLDAGTPPSSARVLPLGASRDVEVGETVIAIGNPLNYSNSVSSGIVSGLKRTICSPNRRQIGNVIQTDAAINQGNSGGPLLDGRGRVIGINSQIATQSGGNEGIGFALPIDIVRPVMQEIIATGRVRHAWIGIEGRELTPQLAKELNVPGTTGVAILTVDPKGPMKAAGLRASTVKSPTEPPKGADIITKVAGRTVRDFGDLSQEVSSRRVGDSMEITYLRNGAEKTMTIKLADRPASVGNRC